MKIKKNIALSDSGFVFDPATGNSFSTNPIGLEIIQLLKAEKSKPEIVKEIVKLYETSEEVAERDFNDFANVLHKMKLLDL